MKAISNLVFELKIPKLSKDKANGIVGQHKTNRVYVVKETPADGTRITMDLIAGSMKTFIPLNNKAIVRIEFDSRTLVRDVEYGFVLTSHDGYVLAPVQ